MKFSLVIASILVAACCAASTDVLLQEQWKNWKKEHNKEYKTTEEELKRFDIWKSNTDFVANHNAEADSGKHTFWVKMNKFGDLTAAEFAKIYNGFNVSLWEKTRPRNARVFEFSSARDVPSSIDWRTQGYVTDIKDQGQCGSCWAFSSTGSLEGQHFKASGKLVSLSEQNLVDCSGKYGNQGCDGGLMDQAFAYIKDNKGIDTEDSYPYEAVDDTCRFDPNNVGATDMGFTDIKSKDENALMQAVGTVGPVSVAIDASHTSFQLYSHGIYHEALCSQTALDHGVLSVGYGSQGTNKDFWIVKNSWGTGWGDKGYIMMSRNRNNNCGIATAASYPNV